MPTVTTPLRPYTDFPTLKKKRERALLAERVELAAKKTLIEERLDILNFELFGDLRSVLPEGVKSVEYLDTCPICGDDPDLVADCAYCAGTGETRHQVTTLSYEPRRTFDAKKAVTKTFACPCLKCRGKEKITLPAKVLDGFYTLGKQPKPSVSVKKLKESETDGDDDDE